MAWKRRRDKVVPYRRRPPRRRGRRASPARPQTIPRAIFIVPGAAAALLVLAPMAGDALNGVVTAHDGCRVVSVVDGDTVRIYCPGDGVRSARLMGFDTPEVFSPECVSEAARGVEATWALRRMIWSAEDVSITRRGTDRYGRDLAIMRIDGADVARTMIVSGQARPYRGGRREGWC
ncbi:hypothetical protein G5B40_19035 [Pikeienuella piscinae]|uniref:TNase-like domain-containing protein n=1 Tax=Pikeienuella piscinae TaxID=2748098 RepID=A0A7M3T5S1_9RHOB|nr:thermonuclease family protein [Pikeienuella piscinae]QIE57352.1 hypothetical protein G5B40_19035 [Pikeienuella piscinae]